MKKRGRRGLKPHHSCFKEELQNLAVRSWACARGNCHQTTVGRGCKAHSCSPECSTTWRLLQHDLRKIPTQRRLQHALCYFRFSNCTHPQKRARTHQGFPFTTRGDLDFPACLIYLNYLIFSKEMSERQSGVKFKYKY